MLQQGDDVGHRRGKLADAQILVKKHRADVGALQQVVHVVIQIGQLLDLRLILSIDAVELLVDRLQFLVGALQLLVRGQQFLVGRLLLFVGRFEFLDGGLEVLFGLLQFLLQVGNALRGLRIHIE